MDELMASILILLVLIVILALLVVYLYKSQPLVLDLPRYQYRGVKV